MSKVVKSAFVAACLAGMAATGAGATTVSQNFANSFVVDAASGQFDFTVGANEIINDVNIMLDFTKCDDPGTTDGTCVGGGFSFNREIVFKLISPAMTVVDLVLEDTYGGQTPGARVQVTFDDDAASVVGGSFLQSGLFRPVGSLASLIGENSAGTWSIFYQDTVGADPLSFNGFRLDINASTVPVPASLPLLAAGLGAMAFVRRRRNQA